MTTRSERIAELQEMLDAVEEAIKKVTAGQSYSLGSRSVTRADLLDLMETRKQLKKEIASASGTGTRRFRRVVPNW